MTIGRVGLPGTTSWEFDRLAAIHPGSSEADIQAALREANAIGERVRTYLRTPRPVRSIRDARSRIPNDLVLGMASALLLCLGSKPSKPSQRRIAVRRVSDTHSGTVLPEGPVEWAPTAEPAPVRRD